MSAERAWLTLIAVITIWEVHALRTNPDRLLSRGVDRLRARHHSTNLAAHVVVLATAAHLLRLLPTHLDPYARVSR